MIIKETPFSFFGSYLSIAYEADNGGNYSLWLKSLRGKSKNNTRILEIIPLENNKNLNYSIISSFSKVQLKLENGGEITICYNTDKQIIMEGKKCNLKLDTHPKFNFEYNYLLERNSQTFCIINSYKNYTKSLVYPIKGSLQLYQSLNVDVTGSNQVTKSRSYIIINQDAANNFQVVLDDIPTNGAIPTLNYKDIKSYVSNSEKTFLSFCSNLPSVSEKYKDRMVEATYILWSSTVRPEGNLKRPTVYASNKDFPGSWSWDHCFIALGLVHIDNNLALDQMFTILDHQDELGQLPGSVSDSSIRWNFSKPPVQGLFFQKITKYIPLSDNQLKYIYVKLEKQINYYLNYKDSNQDGICEYHHGNDSGQDNSTVFNEPVIVDSPDLSAFLIKGMEFLKYLSDKLKHEKKSNYWNKEMNKMINLFTSYFIIDNVPVAKETLSGNVIQSESILPLMSIIMGKHLPKEVAQTLVFKLSSPNYLTEWGISTESLTSPKYQDDAYWRGSIWGPTTLLVVEALEELGEKELSREISEKYCNLIVKSGFAENFNAKTGEPLRDLSFSWTASVFIHLLTKLN